MGKAIKMSIIEILSKKTDVLVNESSTIKELGMDSLEFVEFVIDLETKFDVEIPPDYLSMEEMGTVRHIEEIIERIQNE